MKKAIIFGDTHCGSLVGLTAPKDFDKSTVITQKPLWDWWVKELKEIGKVDFAVCNGDAIDGPGYRDTIGHISTDTKTQRELFYEAVKPIKTSKFYFTFGTPYHVTGSESWEENIAEHFNAEIKDMLYLDVEGHLCRFRHHAGRSDIPYGQGTQLFKEAVRDMLYSVAEESDPAEYLFHSHVHYYFRAESYNKCAVSSPCLQVPESVYGRKMRSMYYDIGFLEIQADKKRFDIIKHIMPIKFVRKREYIKA